MVFNRIFPKVSEKFFFPIHPVTFRANRKLNVCEKTVPVPAKVYYGKIITIIFKTTHPTVLGERVQNEGKFDRVMLEIK